MPRGLPPEEHYHFPESTPSTPEESRLEQCRAARYLLRNRMQELLEFAGKQPEGIPHLRKVLFLLEACRVLMREDSVQLTPERLQFIRDLLEKALDSGGARAP